MPLCLFGSEGNLQELNSSFHRMGSGITRRSLVLAASTFTHRAIPVSESMLLYCEDSEVMSFLYSQKRKKSCWQASEIVQQKRVLLIQLPEFGSWNPRGGKRELTLARCPLTSTPRPWCVPTPTQSINKNVILKTGGRAGKHAQQQPPTSQEIPSSQVQAFYETGGPLSVPLSIILPGRGTGSGKQLSCSKAAPRG